MLAEKGRDGRFLLFIGQDIGQKRPFESRRRVRRAETGDPDRALEPGSLIEKAELCDKFGVSRYPVSSAVSRLAYDQLVDVAPQHGSFVSKISIHDVRERLFIRSALEGEIAAEAAGRLRARQGRARGEPP